jgi:small subunit ribosomal protein S20
VANTIQAKKRAIQSEKHRQKNSSFRSMYRTAIKKVEHAIEAKNKADAEAQYKLATSTLDKMVTKGIIHKNKAARHKSRLAAKIKQI